jgi:hypothetical protein
MKAVPCSLALLAVVTLSMGWMERRTARRPLYGVTESGISLPYHPQKQADMLVWAVERDEMGDSFTCKLAARVIAILGVGVPDLQGQFRACRYPAASASAAEANGTRLWAAILK